MTDPKKPPQNFLESPAGKFWTHTTGLGLLARNARDIYDSDAAQALWRVGSPAGWALTAAEELRHQHGLKPSGMSSFAGGPLLPPQGTPVTAAASATPEYKPPDAAAQRDIARWNEEAAAMAAQREAAAVPGAKFEAGEILRSAGMGSLRGPGAMVGRRYSGNYKRNSDFGLSKLAEEVRGLAEQFAPKDDPSPFMGGYKEPDFTARPEGEAEMEKFLFGRLLSMGRRAAPGIWQQWGAMQQRKSQRVAARAEHFANLIRQRHAGDIQRRNMTDVQRQAMLRSTLNSVTQIGMKEAELQYRANEFMKEMRFKLLGESLKGQTIKPAQMKQAFVAANQVNDITRSLSTLTEFGNLAHKGLGMGYAGFPQVFAERLVGVESRQRHDQLRMELKLDIVRALKSARTADSQKEGEDLKATIPSYLQGKDSTLRWVERARQFLESQRVLAAEEANANMPGLGTRTAKRLEPVVADHVQSMIINNQQVQGRSHAELMQLYGEALDMTRSR